VGRRTLAREGPVHQAAAVTHAAVTHAAPADGNGALRPRHPPVRVAGHASDAGEAAASG